MSERRFNPNDKVVYRGNIYTISHQCTQGSTIGDYYLEEGRCYAWESEVSRAVEEPKNDLHRNLHQIVAFYWAGIINYYDALEQIIQHRDLGASIVSIDDSIKAIQPKGDNDKLKALDGIVTIIGEGYYDEIAYDLILTELRIWRLL